MLRSGEHDDVTLIGAGVTLHACRDEPISCRKKISTRVLSTAIPSSRSTLLHSPPQPPRALAELSSPKTTARKADSVQQLQKRSLLLDHQTCPSCILPSAACQAPDRATNSSPGQALTPTTSQAPRVASSPTLKSERPDAVAQYAAPNRRVPGGHMKRKSDRFITPDKRQAALTERRNLKMARSAHAYVRGNTEKFLRMARLRF